jgi:hypothetical protein
LQLFRKSLRLFCYRIPGEDEQSTRKKKLQMKSEALENPKRHANEMPDRLRRNLPASRDLAQF